MQSLTDEEAVEHPPWSARLMAFSWSVGARAAECAVAKPVQAQIAARHQGRAVGHADRGRRVYPVEADARRRDRVDVRRANDRVTHAAQPVGAMLVGNEKKEIGSLGHCRFRSGAPRTPCAKPHASRMAAFRLANPAESGLNAVAPSGIRSKPQVQLRSRPDKAQAECAQGTRGKPQVLRSLPRRP